MSFIALRCSDPQCELSGDSPARTVGVERNGCSIWSEPERLRVEKYGHYRGGMPGLTTNGLSKKSGGPEPEDDEHLKHVKAIDRENARLANEAPMTHEQAEEISKRST
jgi:hypothetical protein